MQEEYAALDRTYRLLQRRRNIQRILYEESEKQTQVKKKSRTNDEIYNSKSRYNFIKFKIHIFYLG